MNGQARDRLAELGRWLLLFVLALVVAQNELGEWIPAIARPLRWLDELASVPLFALAAWLRLRGRARAFAGEPWLLAFAGAFVAACAASAIVNQTGVAFFVLGTYDYLKGIVYVWIAASLGSVSASGTLRLRRRLVVLVLAVAAVSLCWGFVEVVHDAIVFAGDPMALRLGLGRPRAILNHPNHFGLYMLLALVVHQLLAGGGPGKAVALWLGCAVSLSRLVHLGAVAALAPLIPSRRINALFVMGSLGIVLATAGMTEDEVAGGSDEVAREEKEPSRWSSDVSLRAHAISRAKAILRDHPVLGLGPGRYGGVVSAQLGSDAYDDYPLHAQWQPLFDAMRTLDTFYPQLLAELGVVGATAFAGIAGCLLWLLVRARRRAVRAADSTQGDWALAGAVLVAAVPFYAVGAGLHMAPYLLTSMVIAGLALAAPPADPPSQA